MIDTGSEVRLESIGEVLTSRRALDNGQVDTLLSLRAPMKAIIDTVISGGNVSEEMTSFRGDERTELLSALHRVAYQQPKSDDRDNGSRESHDSLVARIMLDPIFALERMIALQSALKEVRTNRACTTRLLRRNRSYLCTQGAATEPFFQAIGVYRVVSTNRR